MGLAVEQPLRREVHSLTRLDGDAATAPPGRRGTRGAGADKSTAAEEFALVLGEVAEKS